jgi:penicillin amidase
MIALPIAVASGSSTYVIIIRDNYGVPHIFSNTKEGLGFGCGYAMAQDRLWQADIYRRSAFGNLAEFGLTTIEQDYATRSLGYSREELREIFDKWVPTKPSARLKEMFLAYVDGINAYILEALTLAAHGDYSLIPIEYLPGVITQDGLPIQPFSIEDCAAIVVMMAWKFGGTGGEELQYASALQALLAKYPTQPEVAYAIFNDLFPQNDPGAEVTIPSSRCWSPCWWQGCSSIPRLPSNIGDIYKEYEETKMGQTQLLESLGVPTKFGSNAWMVSPSKSTTRNALQVGGPQMGYSIPQIVLEVGLHGAGINAVGMMMPHAPSILIGVSEFGAWTSTTGASDVIDTYIEVLNPENKYQYWFNGAWRDMEKRTERIYGYWKTGYYEERDVYRTIHGPIIAWDWGPGRTNSCYTIKSPYYKNELAAEEGWSLFQQAKNIWEFQDAVKTIQPSHNFFWIDRLGNIGYWHAGTFPIKPTTGVGGRIIDDRLPLYGTGEEEWVGLTGFAEMPKCINPKQGWLANWNNKPIANWPYAESDVGWGEGHRVKRIMDLLVTDKKFSFEDMNTINIDAGYNHIPAMNFLHYLVEAAGNSSDSDVLAALPYLEAWNHHYNDVLAPRWPDPAATYDDPGLTIFDKWYGKILSEVFADDIPSSVMGLSEWQSSTLIHVFDGLASKLPLNYDYLNGEPKNTVIERALKKALAELKTSYGSDISTWLTPVRKTIFSPLGALNQPPNLLRMHYMNRGTYNHIVEMPRFPWLWKPPHAVNVIPPGQSGFVRFPGVPSPHAYDQLPLYETWTYKPMLFRYKDIWDVAESWKVLIYP